MAENCLSSMTSKINDVYDDQLTNERDGDLMHVIVEKNHNLKLVSPGFNDSLCIGRLVCSRSCNHDVVEKFTVCVTTKQQIDDSIELVTGKTSIFSIKIHHQTYCIT